MAFAMQVIYLVQHFFSYFGRESYLLLTAQDQIVLPRTTQELEDVKKGFESKSMERVMCGCVGALDGFLLTSY